MDGATMLDSGLRRNDDVHHFLLSVARVVWALSASTMDCMGDGFKLINPAGDIFGIDCEQADSRCLKIHMKPWPIASIGI